MEATLLHFPNPKRIRVWIWFCDSSEPIHSQHVFFEHGQTMES